MTRHEITVDVLRCLTKYPDPDIKTLKRYLVPKITSKQLFKSLSNLGYKGYIANIGSPRHLRYHLKKSGLELLNRLEEEYLLRNVQNEIDKYLRAGDYYD
ncbi:MAG: hypothetical protein ABR962_10535 [Candidatus Bathyarchaeia archaeon]|jgi:hypothetical protein